MAELTYDRVVVGAGIIGACTAYQLVKAGHRSVLLLDQFPLPHSRGSSHGQSRITRTAYRDPVQGQMARRSRTLWDDIQRHAGETLCHDCPMLLVSAAENRELFETYLACLDDQTVYSGRQLAELVPVARFPVTTVGCLDRTAGVLRADRCLEAVRRLYLAAGGSLRDSWPVTEVSPGVGTAPLVGIDLGPGDNTSHFYWLPSLEYPGLVKLCIHTGVPCDPDRRDAVSTEAVLRRLTEYVTQNFPGLEPEPAIVETCMYTTTPDERCILDVHPAHPNIVFAAGMSGEGFKMGPVFGEVLQRLIDGEPSQFDLARFSLRRFDGARQLAGL
ncbi:peroxisomal sarcosine oxidase-like [Pollicipes pollicipes]|uniref:peroxisomal sarcosine oxidase-like n=1 Tax=Pollicipes pollicipes TaxID=41117 RepID=UPI001885247E|nr:peroxisomal sarcosine oxidase-like [Pollicipes pollicipes]